MKLHRLYLSVAQYGCVSTYGIPENGTFYTFVYGSLRIYINLKDIDDRPIWILEAPLTFTPALLIRCKAPYFCSEKMVAVDTLGLVADESFGLCGFDPRDYIQETYQMWLRKLKVDAFIYSIIFNYLFLSK